MLKAMFALGAVAAIAIGLMLPAPAISGHSRTFMQPGVTAQ
ncbi:MAG: hypothetical protein P4L73_15055 [Caulobacteraceae bacterium]|nr:hypothetical protein [Caulobacteraceae bacterium]